MQVTHVICRMAVATALAAFPAACADLFRDDFSHFPPGWLTNPVGALNGAIQEYHYLANRGVPLSPWANAICQNRVWIYTQDQPFKGNRIHAPLRNPDYNESNYRTNVSLPNWEPVRLRK